MGKEIISEKEGITLSILFLMGGAITFPSGYAAQKDIWIAVILAAFLGILVSLVYSKILSSFPGRDLFDITETLFGKAIGKAVSLLYVWFAFHLGSICFADIVYFIKTVSFPETRAIVIIIFPVILCIWGLKLGIEGLGRFSILALIPICLFIAFAIVLMIPKMKFDNLLPVFENGFQPIFKGTFMLFAFPFAETVLFMGIFNCFREKKSISKVYLISIILVSILILVAKISEVSALGINTFLINIFPGYAAVRLISVTNYIQRIEIIVGLAFSVSLITKSTLCMLVACKGISRIFSFEDYRFLATPMVMLSAVFMFISSKDIVEISSFDALAWRYYAFPFQVILPLIMLALVLIKKKSQNMQR